MRAPRPERFFDEKRGQMFSALAAEGYCLLRAGQVPHAAEAAHDPWTVAQRVFDEVPVMVEHQPIFAVDKGRSFAATSVATPLHTDSQQFAGVAPHAQLMFCAHAASDGGETLLLDSYALLERLEREAPELFQALLSRPRQIPFVFGDVIAPTLALTNGSLVFTHSPQPASDAIGRALAGELSRHKPMRVRVSAGELLIVDNHRMLHGRAAFGDRRRRFSRLLVWLGAGLSRHERYEGLALGYGVGACCGPRAERLLATEDATAQLRLARLIRQVETYALPDMGAGEMRRAVTEMLRGVPPGVVSQRLGVPEPLLYRWRDVALGTNPSPSPRP